MRLNPTERLIEIGGVERREFFGIRRHAPHRDPLHRLYGCFKVGRRHSGDTLGQSLDCYSCPETGFAQVSSYQLLVTRLVGNRKLHLFTETASTKNARVDPVNVVCCTNEEDLVLGFQGADFDKRLFDQLHIMLIHLAAESREEPVHLVEEND